MTEQLQRILETTLRMMPQSLGDRQLETLRSALQEEGSAVRLLWESTIQACQTEQRGDVAWDILQSAFCQVCTELSHLIAPMDDIGLGPKEMGWPEDTSVASMMAFFLEFARTGRRPTEPAPRESPR